MMQADMWERHIAKSLRAIPDELWGIAVALLGYFCEDREQ
jgi:hypothetical protein